MDIELTRLTSSRHLNNSIHSKTPKQNSGDNPAHTTQTPTDFLTRHSQSHPELLAMISSYLSPEEIKSLRMTHRTFEQNPILLNSHLHAHMTVLHKRFTQSLAAIVAHPDDAQLESDHLKQISIGKKTIEAVELIHQKDSERILKQLTPATIDHFLGTTLFDLLLPDHSDDLGATPSSALVGREIPPAGAHTALTRDEVLSSYKRSYTHPNEMLERLPLAPTTAPTHLAPVYIGLAQKLSPDKFPHFVQRLPHAPSEATLRSFEILIRRSRKAGNELNLALKAEIAARLDESSISKQLIAMMTENHHKEYRFVIYDALPKATGTLYKALDDALDVVLPSQAQKIYDEIPTTDGIAVKDAAENARIDPRYNEIYVLLLQRTEHLQLEFPAYTSTRSGQLAHAQNLCKRILNQPYQQNLHPAYIHAMKSRYIDDLQKQALFKHILDQPYQQDLHPAYIHAMSNTYIDDSQKVALWKHIAGASKDNPSARNFFIDSQNRFHPFIFGALENSEHLRENIFSLLPKNDDYHTALRQIVDMVKQRNDAQEVARFRQLLSQSPQTVGMKFVFSPITKLLENERVQLKAAALTTTASMGDAALIMWYVLKKAAYSQTSQAAESYAGAGAKRDLERRQTLGHSATSTPPEPTAPPTTFSTVVLPQRTVDRLNGHLDILGQPSDIPGENPPPGDSPLQPGTPINIPTVGGGNLPQSTYTPDYGPTWTPVLPPPDPQPTDVWPPGSDPGTPSNYTQPAFQPPFPPGPVFSVTSLAASALPLLLVARVANRTLHPWLLTKRYRRPSQTAESMA